MFAAAQVINAVRGVGITRSIRRKLRRAKRAAAKRKRVKQANKADAQEKKQATVNRKADAKAKANEKKKNNTKRQFNNVKSNANANSVAYTRDGPVDNTWLAGEYSETAPIELEKEIAAAALDEVAMALAAEGDSAASAAVASMAVRVAKSESPKKIRLDALANIGSTLSSNLSSNQLVSNTLSGANSPFSFHSAANSEFEAEHGTGNQSKQSNQSFGKSRLGNLTRYDGEISARNRSTSGSQSSPVLSLTQSPESVADAAFEMASKALEMGDDERGLTSDEEAGKIEFLGRKRRQAAREAMDAELERKRLANEASVAMVSAAGAAAAAGVARRASFEEWAVGGSASKESKESKDVDEFLSADENSDNQSVSSYDGSLNRYDSESDVSDVSKFSHDDDRAGRGRSSDRHSVENVFDRAGISGVGTSIASPSRMGAQSGNSRNKNENKSRSLSPSRLEYERRARLSSSDEEFEKKSDPRGDTELYLADGPIKNVEPSNSNPTPSSTGGRPSLRLEVVSGMSRGDSLTVSSVSTEIVTIGRSDSNDLSMGNVEVSSNHAECRWTWFTEFLGDDDDSKDLYGVDPHGHQRIGEWRVSDVGSTNGTFVNGDHVGGGGKRVEWRALRDGDEIRLGERTESPVVRVVLASDAVHASPSEPPTSQSQIQMRFAVRSDPIKPPKMSCVSLTESPLRGTNDVSVFAVFSGHAGSDAAEKAAKHLPEVLSKRLGGGAPLGGNRGTVETNNSPGDATNALRDAFTETNEKIRCEYEGCSVAVLLVWRCKETGNLYSQTANVGDCEIVIGRCATGVGRGNRQAYGDPITKKHLVSDQLERARLISAGASLQPESKTIRGLSVTRTLGDSFLKREVPGLTSVPYVSLPMKIRGDGGDVAVVGTQGVWRCVDANEGAAVATGSGSSSGQKKWTPATGAGRLVDLARRRWSKEDLAVVVVRLEEPGRGT